MRLRTTQIRVAIVFVFALAVLFALTQERRLLPVAGAMGAGPPTGFSGAPGESNCTACHSGTAGPGQFVLNVPVGYVPGQTYQITATHTNADTTRKRWGFQMTSLIGQNGAGTFGNINGNTQTGSDNGRSYINHTNTGTFAGQGGGASWSFSWTAPASDVGDIKFYAAGNQANNDHQSDGDLIVFAEATTRPASVIRRRSTDFDGDGKTDPSIFRPAPGEWWVSKSSDGGNFATQFGVATDKLLPVDFTGDGKTDVAFFRPSTGFWYVLRSDDFSFYAFPFGGNGDVPAPADFDGDLKADAAVFRPSTATWYISKSTGGTMIQQFGLTTDLPVTADYDGDGKADIAVYRPTGANGAEWWIMKSSGGTFATQFGSATDKAVPADYTGDGKADVAFWIPSTGQWFILRSEDLTYYAFPFGGSGDSPVPGDYDGDGKADAAVFRPSNSTWYANKSGGGTLIQQFGQTGDVPVQNAFVR